MKSTILLLAFSAVILGSCTTSYKTGQTPDDVYFSPERPQEEYVRIEKDDDRYYDREEDYYEDRYLRMKVHNRTRWSDLDDWYYYNNRYNYSYYNHHYWSNPWNPYNYWNHYYNPYSPAVIFINPKSNYTYNKPRTFNLNTYNNNGANSSYTNPKVGSRNNGVRIFTGNPNNTNRNTNTNRDAGNFLRDIFNGNNNSSNSSRSSSNTNSSSSPETKSSSGSGNAPVRKF